MNEPAPSTIRVGGPAGAVALPDGAEEQAALVARLDQFISSSIVPALLAIPPLVLIAYFFHKPVILAFCLLCLGQSAVYTWARRQVRQLKLEAAVTGIGIGMWGIALTMVVLVPEVYPFAPLLGMWPVILGLPYIGGRFLLRFIFLSAAVEVVLAFLSVRSQPFPLGIPLLVLQIVAAAVVPALTTLMSILIWQYSNRLNETLLGLRTAVGALQESERLLERRVEERTSELADANAEISQLNQRLRAENVRLSAELEVTRRLQQMVLPQPSELELTPGLAIAAHMQPATEVGGDYYDILQRPGGATKIGIGDVTGHGLESGVLMLMVQMAVRTLMEAGEHDPQRFLDVLNRAVFQNVQRMGSDKNLSLALIDYQDGRLRLSGQHETLLMARPGQPVETIDTIDLGFPVGLVEDISDFVSHTDLILGVDDVVVLYSDGIVEAEDVKGEQYGMDRLRASIDVNRCRTAAEIKNAILNDLLTFIDSHEIYDDITLIVLKQQEQPVSC